MALGDSLTDGLGDPQKDGAVRGWAALLAQQLREHHGIVEFTDLAGRGQGARHALSRQVKPALALDPDLVTVLLGGKDMLLRPVIRPSPVRGSDRRARQPVRCPWHDGRAADPAGRHCAAPRR